MKCEWVRVALATTAALGGALSAGPAFAGERDPVALRNCPDLASPAGHYSHVAIANGFAFVAGQLPIASAGKPPLTDASFEVQVRQALENVRCALRAARLDIDRLVMVNAYIVGIDRWEAFDRIYAEILGAHRPARAIIPVAELHHGYLIEISAVAAALPPATADHRRIVARPGRR